MDKPNTPNVQAIELYEGLDNSKRRRSNSYQTNSIERNKRRKSIELPLREYDRHKRVKVINTNCEYIQIIESDTNAWKLKYRAMMEVMLWRLWHIVSGRRAGLQICQTFCDPRSELYQKQTNINTLFPMDILICEMNYFNSWLVSMERGTYNHSVAAAISHTNQILSEPVGHVILPTLTIESADLGLVCTNDKTKQCSSKVCWARALLELKVVGANNKYKEYTLPQIKYIQAENVPDDNMCVICTRNNRKLHHIRKQRANDTSSKAEKIAKLDAENDIFDGNMINEHVNYVDPIGVGGYRNDPEFICRITDKIGYVKKNFNYAIEVNADGVPMFNQDAHKFQATDEQINRSKNGNGTR